ncbi:MAG TPA: hypothetical protein VK934_10575 [Fimbriimonas sp.]|nr:hypothetical protein [Fimbriimonas sp.]
MRFGSLCSASLSLIATGCFAQTASPWRFVELKMPAEAYWGVVTSVDRYKNAYGYFYIPGPQIPRAVRWRTANDWTAEVLDNDSMIVSANVNSISVGAKGNGTWPYTDAVMWDAAGVLTTIGGLPAHVSSNANSINRGNAVCGSYLDAVGGSYHAFSWLNGVATEIPAFGTLPHSYGRSINDAGFVVGHANDTLPQSTKSYSWIWTKTGGIQELPKLSVYSEAVDINNTGLISGWYRVSGFSKAIVWPIFGVARELAAVPGTDNAQTSAVNDEGVVVGTGWTGRWNRQSNIRALAWEGNVGYDLTNLFTVEGMTLFSATDVNARGDIVGYGSISGRSIGFLLVRKTVS